jgi:hypothetical protein
MNDTSEPCRAGSAGPALFGGVSLDGISMHAERVALAIRQLSGSTGEAAEAMRKAAAAMDRLLKPQRIPPGGGLSTSQRLPGGGRPQGENHE